MTVSLTLDIRTPDGGTLPNGGLVTVRYDRTVSASGMITPDPAGDSLVISQATDPVVSIPYASDDPAVDPASQGYGLIVTARWRQGADLQSWTKTYGLTLADGATPKLSDLGLLVPASTPNLVQGPRGPVGPGQTNAGVASFVTTAGDTQTALDGRYVKPADVAAGYLASTPLTTMGNQIRRVTDLVRTEERVIFGNNNPPGLYPSRRLPFYVSYLVDGSTFTVNDAGYNKVGSQFNTVFQGGFSAEAGTSGVQDPGFLFGADFFILGGSSTKTAGDLAGITDLFAVVGEAHIYDPTASLTHVTGIQGEADIESGTSGSTSTTGATVTAGVYGVKGTASAGAGTTVNDLFSVYATQPVVGKGGGTANVTRPRALFVDGYAQFTGLVYAKTGAGNAPDKGIYLGIAANGTATIELSSGPSIGKSFTIANDNGGNVAVNSPGNRVIANFNEAGNVSVPNGGLATKLATLTAGRTVTAQDSILICANALTLTLPAASAYPTGQILYVKNKGTTGAVTISGTVDGATGPSIANGASGRFVSDGAGWFAL